MPFAAYAPRVAAHPTRTGARRNTAGLKWLVIHTSEGGEGLTSAEGLAAFIATPRTDTNLASYNYIADTDRVIPIVPDDYIAYAQGGANTEGLSICHPGKAAQTAAQWADPISAAQCEQVSRWAADKSRQYGIPLVKVDAAGMRAGVKGVVGHNDVRLAFGKTTHTDPGPNYPWSQVIGRAARLAKPKLTLEEDDVYVVRVRDDQTVWVSNGPWRYAMPSWDAYQALVFVAAAAGRPLPDIVEIAPEQLAGFGVAAGG